MTDRDELTTEIRRFIVEFAGYDDDSLLTRSPNLLESGLIDSMLIAMLLEHLTQRFGCSFEMNEIREHHFRTLATIADLAFSKLSPHATA